MKNTFIEDLMNFVVVAEKKSFTLAAIKLHTNKSVVSKRMQRLESDLGVQLLHRSTRNLSLTEAGEKLYSHGLRIREEISQAKISINENADIPSGTVRVHSSLSFGHLHLVPAIADFLLEYPRINIEIMLGSQDENIVESSVDLAIRMGPLADSGLIAQKLTTRPMRVCASPDYLKQHGKPKTPQDLTQHNCLINNRTLSDAEWEFKTDEGKKLVRVNGNFASSSRQVLETAAVAGIGIVKLPGYMMTHHIKKKKLIPLLDEYSGNQIDIFAVYHQTEFLPLKVRVLVDFLKDRFRNESYWN